MNEVNEIADFPGYFITAKGGVYSVKRGLPYKLATWPVNSGHLQVRLYHPDRDVTPQYIHHLVMACFGPPAPHEKKFVLHNDDDPSNNGIENLYWGDSADNGRDRTRNKSAGMLQLKHTIVAQLKLLAPMIRTGVLAKMFAASRRQVANATAGRTFAHVAALNADELERVPKDHEMHEIQKIGKQDDENKRTPYTEEELKFHREFKFALMHVGKN